MVDSDRKLWIFKENCGPAMYQVSRLIFMVFFVLISKTHGLQCKNGNCNEDAEMAAREITKAPEKESSGTPTNASKNVLKCYQCSNNQTRDPHEPCTNCRCKDDEQGTIHQIEF